MCSLAGAVVAPPPSTAPAVPAPAISASSPNTTRTFGVSTLTVATVDAAAGTAYLNVWASKDGRVLQSSTVSLGKLSAGSFDLSGQQLAHVNVTAGGDEKVAVGAVILTAASAQAATAAVQSSQAALIGLPASTTSVWASFPRAADGCGGVLAADRIGPAPLSSLDASSLGSPKYTLAQSGSCSGSDLQVALAVTPFVA